MAEETIHVFCHSGRYHVVLRHADGTEEISDQSWDTREECEKAIEQYVKDRGVELSRTQ
jgi:hypothetical protein